MEHYHETEETNKYNNALDLYHMELTDEQVKARTSNIIEKYVEENWDNLMANHQLISLEQFEHLTSDIRNNYIFILINHCGTQIVSPIFNKFIVQFIPNIGG